ncbi:MAG: response regulator transcription factor [Oscillospiraceae bacterium]|nr:response regulator transcription factor [Oscillospiraceae bacterium]
MKRILVCEDEENIREMLCLNLKKNGYDVVDVGTGEDALAVYLKERGKFDIALLDIMLPGITGLTVCKELREKDSSLGIIMLTAKTQEMDKIGGLMLGADDYVTKPFSVSELMARVDAIYRRVSLGSKAQNNLLTSGPFELNIKNRTLQKNGRLIDLTQVEFQLMELFLQNPDTVLERDLILDKIWGSDYFGDDKIIDVNIRRLRMKIEDEPSRPSFIATVWGAGYKWKNK